MTMLTCREVCRSIASEASETAGWRQRLSIKLHLLLCRYCRRYSRQIEAIGSAARVVFGPGPTEPKTRDRLRDSILERIPRNREDESDSEV